MLQRISCFVMSGGAGSRLWPLSREDNPKQFHDLSGNGSMLVRTVRRLQARHGGETPIHLIASERHAERVHADLGGIDLAGGTAIFEPVGRNTAGAVAIAALKTMASHGDGLVLVVPSDHEISTDADFWQTIENGVPAARDGHLVVFGLTPAHPETGYGYIEVAPADEGRVEHDVLRFVEKPDMDTAISYLEAGTFFWNTGIFLFRASAMEKAFRTHQPSLWEGAQAAFAAASANLSGLYLPLELYSRIDSVSIDYAIMEHAERIAMVPASFRWNDLGSWQSLLEVGRTDANGNAVVGDVIAIDCEHSYLRSQGRLLAVIGLKDLAIVSTADATVVAPVAQSQNVKRIVEQLERSGRLEAKFTPAHDRVLTPGAWRNRVSHWLMDETMPLWSTAGIDRNYGGFHEALSFDGTPLVKPKRMRTMARQVYAFAVAKQRGWTGPADELIALGIDFMSAGRTDRGGWARVLDIDGTVTDPCEDAYDHACVLLALAHAHAAGHGAALKLGEETFAFIEAHLEDEGFRGFLETSDGAGLRRTNPHMHLLEAFLAWHSVTGDRQHLRHAARVIDLFCNHFFDADSWTLGEYFENDWQRAHGKEGQWTEPGHHFEWASLLVDFAARSGRKNLLAYARKLYASAIANGLNRATGLAYGAVSREGSVLDRISRSWPQAEAIKAAVALDGTGGPELEPEIEARVGQLFRWHIDPAPTGLWIDRIDDKGRAQANEVPASIFYHLVTALMQYLDKTDENAGGASVSSLSGAAQRHPVDAACRTGVGR